jgi:hypothetical protein
MALQYGRVILLLLGLGAIVVQKVLVILVDLA